MCLNPRRLVNPQKRISKLGGQMFALEVPCGECAECKEMMRTEWYFRSYYQCKEIYDANGYVYFDTLTYDNEHLPHVSDIIDLKDKDLDFPCFNVAHYRRFLLDVRQHLARNGYDDVKFGYFMTTEYGLNPKDGRTFRPHYHILFFVKNNRLHPSRLSKIVAKYWKYGRTDGLPYQNWEYVKKHVFGKTYTRDFVHMRSVCNYVSKYVTKDSDFQQIINERLGKLYESIDRESYILAKNKREKYKKVKRAIDQFHRQSQGFGAYMLVDPEVDLAKVTKTGMMSMPDRNSIIKHTPISSYYLRKLFYEKKKDREGNEYWTLSDMGKVWKLERWLKTLEVMEKRYRELYQNVSVAQQQKIDNYLGNRTLKDFCIYNLFYKGRTRYMLRERQGLQKQELNLDYWVQLQLMDTHTLDDSMVLFHYCSQSDKYRFNGSSFITDKNLGNKDAGYIDGMAGLNYGYDDTLDRYYGDFATAVQKNYVAVRRYGNCMRDDLFMKRFIINQNTDEKFKSFDELGTFFKVCQLETNEKKQELFDYKEKLKKKLKILTAA